MILVVFRIRLGMREREGMKRLIFLLVLHLIIFSFSSNALAKAELVVYTSVKDVLISRLRDAFASKYPDIDLDYYSAGAGKLMVKIAGELQSGSVGADVVWTSEISDFFRLKHQGALERYIPSEWRTIVSPVKDPDGFFTPVRLGTLGIAYNTKKVATPPKSWEDLLDSRFRDGFGIANPAFSGTAWISVAMIAHTMGWDYIDRLKANGAKMGQGSLQLVADTASGDLKASIAIDYITVEKIEKGATLGFMYPKEMMVIPSPVAIFKGASHPKAARKFVNFLLSREGQEIIASAGMLPVRDDVSLRQGFNLVSPREAEKRAMRIDYPKTINEKDSIIQKFTSIMRTN